MGLNVETDSNQNRLIVEGELTIYHVADAKAALLSLPDATLDLSGITEIDGAGVQMLMLAHRDAGLNLGAVSDTVGEVLRLTGLTAWQTESANQALA
ncbi:MAG: lipid asymmetry maintenance protein MlaB [Thiotrichales bacterium]